MTGRKTPSYLLTRHRQTDRDRETGRNRQRDTDRQTETGRDRHRQKERQRDRERQRHRQTEAGRDRERQTQAETETETQTDGEKMKACLQTEKSGSSCPGVPFCEPDSVQLVGK